MALSVPPSGDAVTVLTQWTFEPVTMIVLLGSASLYAAGVIANRRAGAVWSRSSTAAFSAGIVVLVVALVSPVDVYADISFSAHMTQHLLLTLLAPPLLALGAPITLALRAASPAMRRRLIAALRTPVASALAHPLVGWTLFAGVPVIVHASPLFDLALRSTPWHAFEHGLWLTAALIFWWPVVGVDPNPHPVVWPVRLLSLFLAMPAMSFLAVAIYSARAPLYPTYASLPAPWGEGAFGDQRNAAVIMWLAGNLALVVAMLVTAAAWKRDDDARQHRREARQDRAEAAAAAPVESA